MNYYNKLGIQKDATPELIRRAYKTMASIYHPDKRGGDTAAMAEVNIAYACLSDPDRRAEYDRTGAESTQPTLEAEARDVLVKVFNELLSRDVAAKFVERAQEVIAKSIAMQLQQQRITESGLEKLKKRKDKVMVAEGKTNLFLSLVEQQIRTLEQNLVNMRHSLAVLDEAEVLLEDYSSNDEVDLSDLQLHSHFVFT